MTPPGPITFDNTRRNLLVGGATVGAAFAAGSIAAPTPDGRSDTEPRLFDGQPMPEPSPEQSAGPIRPGRGSTLAGKVAVVTGAARGIGRAIAVEFAANGADVVAVDICGFVSTASNAKPATTADLDETIRQVHGHGRKGEGMKADIRDIGALRRIADDVEARYGGIDIVVADAAIQRWVPLLQMTDADWSDVIDNNLNGTANTIRAFAPKMVARAKGRIIVLSSMQGLHGTKDAASYSASKWGILGLMKSAAMELGQYNITERRNSGPRRHRFDSLRETLLRECWRRGRQNRESHAAASVGHPRADSALEGRLASARRYLARRRVSRFGRGGDGHRRRISGHRRRQRKRCLTPTSDRPASAG
jgi:NAD(P)-dependent dehydrogenase (short-subunit alcohol dehydrogenase family)